MNYFLLIIDTLQRKEGKFRSILIKKHFFRRVPRVEFRCIDPTLGLGDKKSIPLHVKFKDFMEDI